ncbi:MAG: ABC transporter ATP-binding protein [Thermoplasmata archaeon]|nr:ABC transporter ATP-binding protein [Thermoplasmata archaeon]
MALLEVKGLRTYFKTQEGTLKAVDGVDFTVEKGQALGLAGESGCGKTTAALSIMKLLPANGYIAGGSINFMGQDMAKVTGEKLRSIRWRDISIVFQGAMNALNPVKRVGDQIMEPILLHEDVDEEIAMKRVKELFELVGISPNRVREYPHEFSGGMRQRVMIAMALACKPRLVIADEPTTALDVMIQAQILQLMKSLQKDLDLAMIIISHDLSVLAETCENLSIMYAGKIVERAVSVEVFRNPQHPYTKGLIGAFPNIKGEKIMPASIAGNPPNLIHAPKGCRFAERCYAVKDICHQEEPELIEVLPDHFAACHFVKKGGA